MVIFQRFLYVYQLWQSWFRQEGSRLDSRFGSMEVLRLGCRVVPRDSMDVQGEQWLRSSPVAWWFCFGDYTRQYTGWLVVWLPFFIVPEILGISSSQLTKSYFSEQDSLEWCCGILWPLRRSNPRFAIDGWSIFVPMRCPKADHLLQKLSQRNVQPFYATANVDTALSARSFWTTCQMRVLFPTCQVRVVRF